MKLLVALAAVAFASGCGPLPGDRASETAATPQPTTPAVILDRSRLPSCGQERRTGQAGPVNADGRRCLWEAYLAGEPAEFVVTQLTVEGDPVTDYWRVLGKGSVELLEDSTKDPWGSGPGWLQVPCDTLVLLPASTDKVPQFDLGPGCREAAEQAGA
jgi:hypothetical protein